jgi:hypothetical protein
MLLTRGTSEGQSYKQGGAPGNSTGWLTPVDVSASAELAAEIRRLMADKDWHSNGEQYGE